MDTSFILLLIVQLILLGVLLVIIYTLLINTRTMNLENRFNNYSLTSSIDQEKPLFQKIIDYYWKVIKKVSVLLNKSQILKKYGNHFDKYIDTSDTINKNGLDYVSIKFILSFIIGLLYLITTLFRSNFNPMILLLIIIISFFIIDIYFNLEYKRKRKQIEEDLLNAIIIMNNAFKSGMNIMQAINIVESELTGPIKEEFKKINIDIKYGLSLETVFDRFYNRVKIDDIKYISSSLSLINKTGGNIVKVFGSIEKNFYDKKKIKDEMNSLTSSSLFMFRLLVVMPVILSIIILTLNREFFSPLINTSLGKLILLIILILYIIYIIIVKRIMKVDV